MTKVFIAASWGATLNYRHIYHAGGLADIVKHLTLAHLLKRLAEKPQAFAVMDTHAAIGLYNLSLPEAQKTGEAALGAAPFLNLPASPALAPFHDILRELNPEGHARLYPGSPEIIRRFLREHDRLIAIEKHPDDAKILRRFLGEDNRIQIHARDGWEAVSALLPVKETRALVFIDPPYEQPDEFDQALNAIHASHARMKSAIFALWYPLKDAVQTGRMLEALSSSALPKILRAEVMFTPRPAPGKMHGSGMVIVNAPWKLDEALREAYAALEALIPGAPAPRIEWLKAE